MGTNKIHFSIKDNNASYLTNAAKIKIGSYALQTVNDLIIYMCMMSIIVIVTKFSFVEDKLGIYDRTSNAVTTRKRAE